MKRCQSNAATNGARFQKKQRDGFETMISVVSFDASAVQQLTLEQSAASATYPANRFYPPTLLLGDKRPCFKLSPWLELKFGVDARVWDKAGGNGEPPPQPGPVPDTARLNIAVDDPDLLAAFEGLDKRAQELFLPLVPSPHAWQPLLKRVEKSGSSGGGSHAAVKIYLKARQGACPVPATQMKVRQPDGTDARGQGWGFLEKNLEACDGFRGGRCKLALELQYWCMNGNAGLTLQAFAMVLQPAAACSAPVPGLDIEDIFPEGELG